MSIAVVPRPQTPLANGTNRSLGQRERREHREVERQLHEVARRAREGDWHELDAAWRRLSHKLEAHLSFEERELFPAYAANDPARRAEVEQLSAEHERLRELLDRIGIEIQLHALRAHSVDAFVALNRKHMSFESRRFYPWANGYTPLVYARD